MSIVRPARRFGRPPAGNGLILTMTSIGRPWRGLLLSQPETGRGDASLWTTLRGPLDPSRLPTSPRPRRRLRVAGEHPITTNQRRTSNRAPAPFARVGRVAHQTGPDRWAIPEHQSGPLNNIEAKRCMATARTASLAALWAISRMCPGLGTLGTPTGTERQQSDKILGIRQWRTLVHMWQVAPGVRPQSKYSPVPAPRGSRPARA